MLQEMFLKLLKSMFVFAVGLPTIKWKITSRNNLPKLYEFTHLVPAVYKENYENIYQCTIQIG